MVHCVIGSGPSGVACAKALLQRGAHVLMLDAGIRLEPERAQIVESLKLLKPEEWNPSLLLKLQEGMDPKASGIPEKRLFGSDYPYQGGRDHLGITGSGVGLRASLALGGLSTVWGAAMLPHLARDTLDWPVSTSQLAPHYRSVLQWTGLSGESDGLDALFPLFGHSPGRLESSRQASEMLRRLNLKHEQLRERGIHYGRARVAIKAARDGEPGCVHCGFCLYGCPYGYIYRSEDTVAQMRASHEFRYEPDVVVTTVREGAADVTIAGYHRLTREPLKFTARRVYLASGVLPTTQILLRSVGAYHQPIRIKDSQYFLLPALLTRRVADVRQEHLHTLSQIFLEIIDDQISPHAVHLQVYSFSDLIGKAVGKALGGLARPLDFFARELEGRLLLIQGFIHSAHSSPIVATLLDDQEYGRESLQLKPEINPQASQTVRRVVWKLLRNARMLGVIPLPMMLQVAEPGRSFHAGGSFPMRTGPSGFESDLLGRPAGWKRVHAVDATVFPSIPATTITFSAMANAHRIGSEAADLE